MRREKSFDKALQKVVDMPRDQSLRSRLDQLGFGILNVMWEDTARTAGSVWGPNITDMTLQVRHPSDPDHRQLLPVIRYPNFSDKTGDVPLDLVKIKVGNEKSDAPTTVTLRDYLSHLPDYVSDRATCHADNQSLITDKDTHVLVSAQACFLPIPEEGTCEFNPVLFNYQSRKDDPAVLAIVASTEGSSATAIDNDTDLAAWGQNLYFNNNGQKTCLTGERLSDFKVKEAEKIASEQGISVEAAQSQVDVAQDVNLVMVIQVPLKHKERDYESDFGDMICGSTLAFEGEDLGDLSFDGGDVEDAVIGHGEDEGAHAELGSYKLERDDRFPIRITVQFYKATSNGVVDDKDLQHIQMCIDAAYTSADYIGSLVLGTIDKGAVGMGEARPTQAAPTSQAITGPPKDTLDIVNPFEEHHEPTAGNVD